MKKITKKENSEFISKLSNELIGIGANKIKEDNSFVSFELETIVGKLTIKIDKDNVTIFSVFSRFDDYVRAAKHFDSNPFTGKYNFHMAFDGKDVDSYVHSAAEFFKNTI